MWSFLGWFFGLYYVLLYVVFVCAMYISWSIYDKEIRWKVFWVYGATCFIPFLGLVLWLYMWREDLALHFNNKEHEYVVSRGRSEQPQ